MRYIALFLFFSITNTFLGQNQQFYNLGQAIPANKNACLVIKNNIKQLQKLPTSINKYKDASCIKLVGFDNENYTIDSLISSLKSYTQLHEITFENCDLSSLETSFANFKELEKISIIKQSRFFENTFFPLLKNNRIKELHIQTNDPDIITDSLQLLTHLTSIQISSSSLFNKANYSITTQIKNQNTTQNIEMAYFGDFYKANTSGVKSKKTNTNPIVKTESTLFSSKLDCIKQPMPGIKINDTLYSFNPTQKADFTYKSGTTLSIDRNAFVNQTGEKYEGNVNLFYREFRNPVEIMLSGIPMTNNVDGTPQLFKSGGMYEINAFDASNKPLNLVSDTSIKINFTLTDTSQSFQFFNLNNDGHWATITNSITVAPITKSTSARGSKAVQEYFAFLRNRVNNIADTVKFNDRFYSNDYLYTYRKDNFEINKYKKNNDTNYVKPFTYKKKSMKAKALFRVKYTRLTKDKQIVFTIVRANKYITIPSYVHALIGKNYLYTGNLTKDEFKKVFNRKLLCWDVRTTCDNSVINMDIKTEKVNHYLPAQIISLKDDKSYIVQKKSAKFLNQNIARHIRKDARKFDKVTRFDYYNLNNLNFRNIQGNKNKDQQAFAYCKKWQNNTEKPMDFKAWKMYVKIYASMYSDRYSLEMSNELGTALLKSGLGTKNIDCYLHNGTMENIFVQYNNIPFDSLRSEYNTVLFKNINTNYLLSSDNQNSLNGYLYKYGPNYIIRFSNNNTMQVTKSNAIKGNKTSNMITLDYVNQFNVKGLDSDAITKLIMD